MLKFLRIGFASTFVDFYNAPWDICRLCYLLNACLSETAVSAPEVRTVCLQLPLKHINMILVISKLHGNVQHKMLNKRKHPVSVRSHWNHVISLTLAVSVTEDSDEFCRSRRLCSAHSYLPQSKIFTRQAGRQAGLGGRANKPYKSRIINVQPDCCCSRGEHIFFFFFFPKHMWLCR